MADNKNQPWIENYPPLHAWLQAHEARCDWQQKLGTGNRASYIEQWRFRNGEACIVEVRSHGMGWEIYTAPHTGNDVKETLQAATLALHLAPSSDDRLKRCIAMEPESKK